MAGYLMQKLPVSREKIVAESMEILGELRQLYMAGTG